MPRPCLLTYRCTSGRRRTNRGNAGLVPLEERLPDPDVLALVSSSPSEMKPFPLLKRSDPALHVTVADAIQAR